MYICGKRIQCHDSSRRATTNRMSIKNQVPAKQNYSSRQSRCEATSNLHVFFVIKRDSSLLAPKFGSATGSPSCKYEHRRASETRCFFFSGIDVNGSKRLSPTPSVSNLSPRPCRYLSTVTRSSSRGSVDGFRRERLRDLRPLTRSRCKCILKQDNEWKEELPCVT